MSDPRGAAGGSAVHEGPLSPDPTSVDVPIEGAPSGLRVPSTRHPSPAADAALDETVHAHVLDDPLPPADDDADPPLFAATRAPEPVGAAADPAPGPLAGSGGSPTSADAADDDAGTLPGTSPASPSPDAPSTARARHTRPGPARPPLRRRRAFRVAVGCAVGVALLAGAGLTGYLYQSARAWRDHADGYLREAQHLGEELSTTRSDLAGAQAELEAVRDQLSAAHQRITELASEKAQISDEWEITQQLVDYQERISDAAGQVALALDQCVQSQQELIGYLARAAETPRPGNNPSPPPYDPAQLAQFESDVEAFCQAASEANISLQQELAR